MRKVATSGVPAWQRYFEQPSEPNFPKNGICTANLIVIAVPTFVDRSRRTLVPRTPVDRCGHPVGWPEWREVPASALACRLGAPDQAAHHGAGGRAPTARCRWGTPSPGPDHRATPGPAGRSSPGRRGESASASSGRRPDNFAVGSFVRGFRLDGSRTRRLLGALTGGRTETRLREAAHVRGHHREPRLGRAGRARRVLARRATRSPRRHREPGRREGDPRRLGVAAHAEVRDRDAADPDQDQPEHAAETELPVLRSTAAPPQCP